jgi:acyl-CoA thioesterase
VSAPDSPLHALIAQSNYSRAMGFRLLNASDGSASIECVIASEHANTRGVCHGGVISGLMDMAAGVATKSLFRDVPQTIATVSLTVNYQRSARVGGTLTATATVRSGRRIVSCEILVRDDQGEPIAMGMATLSVSPSRSSAEG